jgi:hypothetical protein
MVGMGPVVGCSVLSVLSIRPILFVLSLFVPTCCYPTAASNIYPACSATRGTILLVFLRKSAGLLSVCKKVS